MSLHREKRVREGQRWAIKSSYYPYYRQRCESIVARARVGRVYTHCRTMCTRVHCVSPCIVSNSGRIDNPAETVQDRTTVYLRVMLALIRPSVRKYGAVIQGRETERRMNLLAERFPRQQFTYCLR